MLVPSFFHAYVYGAVPPLTSKSIVPFSSPLHLTPKPLKLEVVVETTASWVGWVIVAVLVIVQPLLSVTVSSYVPVPKSLILAVVELILVPSFFHA